MYYTALFVNYAGNSFHHVSLQWQRPELTALLLKILQVVEQNDKLVEEKGPNAGFGYMGHVYEIANLMKKSEKVREILDTVPSIFSFPTFPIRQRKCSARTRPGASLWRSELQR